MKVVIIGTGYVGLPTGVGLAELGHTVVCIDKDEAKIKKLNARQLTLFESGLEELFKKNIAAGRLTFSTTLQDHIPGADIVILAVGTPPHPVTKEADLSFIYAAVEEVAPLLKDYTVLATKSTVPVGTGDKIEEILEKTNPKADVDVVSLPEFLREGFAIHDFFHPDRIVIGTKAPKAIKILTDLYQPLGEDIPLHIVSRRSSETIKYASNAFLAVKIHYINEMANFCEKTGADIAEVAKGMGLDSRIGPKFLQAGPGYGGSCFPKDTNAMAYMGREAGVNLSLIETTIYGNDARKQQMSIRIIEALKDIPHPKIALLGLAFKGGTDDCRESPAVQIIGHLVGTDADLVAFDPQAMEQAKKILGDNVNYAPDAYTAVQGADAVVILTEWTDFKTLDWDKIKPLMRTPRVLDFRNLLDKQALKEKGFIYQKIG